MNRKILTLVILCFAITTAFAKKKVTKETERVPGAPAIHLNSFHQEVSFPLGGLFVENEYQLLYVERTKTDENNVWTAALATSKDLMVWKKQEITGAPTSILPDSIKTGFQGSFITDAKNVTGSEANNWYIFYSENNSKLRVSKSSDKGKSWTDDSASFSFATGAESSIQNPHVNFDPESNTWIMTVFREELGTIEYYNSSNLKEWTKKGSSPEKNNKAHLDYIPTDKQWMMIYGREYILGNLTEGVFAPESSKKAYDYGRGFIDFQIINKADTAMAIGFVNNENTSRGDIIGGITYPKNVSIKTAGELKYIHSEFNDAIYSYYKEPLIRTNKTIYPGLRNNVLASLRSESYILNARFTIKSADSFGILVQGRRDKRGKEIAYLTKTNAFQTMAGTMPIAPEEGGAIEFKMLVDKNMVSIIVGEGSYCLTFYTHYDKDGKQIFFYSKGGEYRIDELNVAYERFSK